MESKDLYIHWEKKYETGHPVLDIQHKLLFLLFRKLDVAIKTKQSEEILARIVLEVRKFVDFHFVSEENLMIETGYPDFVAHSKLHTDLMIELNLMFSRVVSHHEFPENLLEFLNTWLIGHINEHDRHIAKHILGSTMRPVAENIYEEHLCK